MRMPFAGALSSRESPSLPSSRPSSSLISDDRTTTQSTTKGTRTGASTPVAKDNFDDVRYHVMCSHIHREQCIENWFGGPDGSVNEGTMLRRSNGDYAAMPAQFCRSDMARAISALDFTSALTMNSAVIRTFLQLNPDEVPSTLPLPDGLSIQCLPLVQDLPRARKHQCAALIISEGLLVVWDDDPTQLVSRAQTIQTQLMKLVWGSEDSEESIDDVNDEKKKTAVVTVDSVSDSDQEAQNLCPRRTTHLQNSFLVAVTLALVTVMVGAAFRSVAIEIAVDRQYLRIAFLLLTPLQVFFSLFFCQVIVGCLAQMCGPVKQLAQNSRYFSGLKSPRLVTHSLPHVTIQCPVYKEGLRSVIQPTVKSIKAAISTYEMQGGSANILINDDGLQLVSEEERSARLEFYQDNNIGFVARPGHNVDGFVRRGKFKKASNMNYALMISCQVEEKLAAIDRNEKWSFADEADAYAKALISVLDEHKGRAWADGNIRIGDYILLIDSDTRVPADCLLDACSEMEQSPDVGILQFSSGVMNVTGTFFENGITFFTNLIYTAIRYTVANGDVAPFVGHNAMLRWSAIQQVLYMDEDDYEKFWSESHVSEDFDMSLRLQVNGFIIRMAAWAGDGFKEGVSLTVYDELARWEKYAYGCNELLFHPIRFWLWRGPFTPLFRSFLFSNIRFTSKITIVSYIGTYYAIGAAWIMTVANYIAVGFYNGYLDKYYIDSWRVWFSIIIVFNGLGNIALATLRYRMHETAFFPALLENIKWIPMFAIFLGGLSLHVSQALLSHMFEINMTWGATSKEAEQSNFWIEVPRVMRRFKFSIAFAVVAIVALVVLSFPVLPGIGYQINDFTAILPLATVAASHLLLPIVLNPGLMFFLY